MRNADDPHPNIKFKAVRYLGSPHCFPPARRVSFGHRTHAAEVICLAHLRPTPSTRAFTARASRRTRRRAEQHLLSEMLNGQPLATPRPSIGRAAPPICHLAWHEERAAHRVLLTLRQAHLHESQRPATTSTRAASAAAAAHAASRGPPYPQLNLFAHPRRCAASSSQRYNGVPPGALPLSERRVPGLPRRWAGRPCSRNHSSRAYAVADQ